MKKTLWITGSFVLICILGLIIPKNTKPPNDLRIILEHTHQTYIAPPCFEQANATNFLEEAALEKALELGYTSHDNCTEAALQEENDSLFISFLKSLGVIQTKWDEW